MISESPVAAIFGAIPAGDETTSLIHQARAMIRAGYAMVLCKPGTKIPVCTLNSTEANRADEAARAQAREAGKRSWDKVRHPCGLKHAITDEKTSDRVIKRLSKSHGRVNLGIELRASKVIVVDVDTEAEDAAFHAAWHKAAGAPLPFGMTVRSPGVYDDETWKHKNGGHYWFTLPEGMVLPDIDGALKMPDGWVIMWADRQVLVPPSVRPEGPYELVGDAHEAPAWLLKTVLKHMLERKQRLEQQAVKRAERLASGDPDATIDVWSAETPWREILEPDGWYDTGGTDRCGTECEIWTAPGVHGSPKSATAHGIGCTDPHYDDSAGHLPLHLWTTNPPEFFNGFETVSKIQYVALRDFGSFEGDALRQACRALGIASEGGSRSMLTALSPAQAHAIVPNMALATTPNGAHPPEVVADPLVPPSDESEARGEEYPIKVWYFADEFDSVPEREEMISGLLLANSYVRIIGKSNHGKSFLAVDWSGHIATGRPWAGHEVRKGRVAYIAAEDSPGIMARVQAWERAHDTKLGRDFLLRVEGVQVHEPEAWSQLIADMKGFVPSVVVIDTQAASSYGIKENDNDEAKVLNQQMQMLRESTGATVIVVHHKGHTGEHGRGASVVLGALDTEVAIDKSEEESGETGTTLVKITCTKQKHAQQFAEIAGAIESVPGTSSAALRMYDPLSRERERPGSGRTPRELIAAYIYENGNGQGGVSKSVVAAAKANRDGKKGDHWRLWNKQLNRVWKDFIAAGHLLDAATGGVLVSEVVGDVQGTVLATPSRRVVLAPGVIQELGLDVKI